MEAEDVEVWGQTLEEELLGELLDAENVSDEGVASESLHGEGVDGGLGGEDGGAEDDHVGVHLAGIVGVAVVSDAELGGNGVVVAAGGGDDVVAVLDKALGELAEVAEADDADLQLALLLNLGALLRLEVERLGGVERARREAERAAEARGGWRVATRASAADPRANDARWARAPPAAAGVIPVARAGHFRGPSRDDRAGTCQHRGGHRVRSSERIS